MALSLHINREDTRAIYHQIAAQIKNQISTGRLPPGTRLPSVREMAHSLHVNRLTVHNAYSELQADGWVESTVGRGTYVIEQPQPMTMLESVGNNVGAGTVLHDIYPIRQMPTLRSLAYSEPDSAYAPTDEIFGNLIALRRDGGNLLRYDSPQGSAPLRVEIANLLHERSVAAMPGEIIVTSGAMQGISLAAQVLAKPGDTVLIEQPTYLGLIHILKTFGIQPIGIPIDDEGPDLNLLEHLIQTENPRFFYTIPGFQNPTGYCMSASRRRELLELAKRYRLPIIEDDIYSTLSYDSAPPTPLKAQDTENLVVYVSSFSKVLAPGLRIGYMVPPPELYKPIISHRLAMDLFSPSVIQVALANFLHQGRLKSHMRRVLPVYRARRDAMMRALERHMPEDVTWTRPGGGFSTWITLPQDNMMCIYEAALQRSIAFTPGEAFLTEHTNRHMRLCFGTQPAEDLDEIVAMLAHLIRHHQDERRPLLNENTLWTPMA